VFCLTLGSAGVSVFSYCSASAFRSRFEILDDQVRDVGVFRTNVLRLDEIRGFRIIPTDYTPTLLLESKTKSLRNIKTALIFDRRWEIVAWASERLPDLTAEESIEEVDQILASADLGVNESERAAKLETARKWTRIVNVLGGVVALWGLLYPEPLDLVRWSLVAAPIAAIGLVHRFPGFIKLDSKASDLLPSVAPATLFPTLILTMHAFFGWNILSWHSFWFPFGALFALLFLVLRSSAIDVRRGVAGALVAVILCAIYAYAAVVVVNGLLGSTERAAYTAPVLAKRESSGDVISRYLVLGPWGLRESDAEVEVSSSVFERYQVGDEATIIVREGRLGIPWFRVR
jgi:hypothetical protein